MNTNDKDMISNERFYNRTYGVWTVVGETVAVAAVSAVWVLLCAVA